MVMYLIIAAVVFVPQYCDHSEIRGSAAIITNQAELVAKVGDTATQVNGMIGTVKEYQELASNASRRAEEYSIIAENAAQNTSEDCSYVDGRVNYVEALIEGHTITNFISSTTTNINYDVPVEYTPYVLSSGEEVQNIQVSSVVADCILIKGGTSPVFHGGLRKFWKGGSYDDITASDFTVKKVACGPGGLTVKLVDAPVVIDADPHVSGSYPTRVQYDVLEWCDGVWRCSGSLTKEELGIPETAGFSFSFPDKTYSLTGNLGYKYPYYLTWPDGSRQSVEVTLDVKSASAEMGTALVFPLLEETDPHVADWARNGQPKPVPPDDVVLAGDVSRAIDTFTVGDYGRYVPTDPESSPRSLRIYASGGSSPVFPLCKVSMRVGTATAETRFIFPDRISYAEDVTVEGNRVTCSVPILVMPVYDVSSGGATTNFSKMVIFGNPVHSGSVSFSYLGTNRTINRNGLTVIYAPSAISYDVYLSDPCTPSSPYPAVGTKFSAGSVANTVASVDATGRWLDPDVRFLGYLSSDLRIYDDSGTVRDRLCTTGDVIRLIRDFINAK